MPQVRDARRLSAKAGPFSAASARVPSLAWDGRAYFTRSEGGRARVYGEVTRADPAGRTWRRWDPYRSKLAAAILAGGLSPAAERLFTSGPVVYLGAASGTTVSHVADLAAPAAVFAVEHAARSFAELLVKLKPWTNVFPVHADARAPDQYAPIVGRAGAIVQDVAQADQVGILAANARTFLPGGSPCALFVKARSVDSSAEPARVFAKARAQCRAAGFEMVEERGLQPYDRDHRAFFMKAPA